jgi:hypothetical protein
MVKAITRISRQMVEEATTVLQRSAWARGLRGGRSKQTNCGIDVNRQDCTRTTSVQLKAGSSKNN